MKNVFVLYMPPESVAEAFTKRIRPEVDRIIALIHEFCTLGAIRDALLPKLLSGELRVPDVARFVENAK